MGGSLRIVPNRLAAIVPRRVLRFLRPTRP